VRWLLCAYNLDDLRHDFLDFPGGQHASTIQACRNIGQFEASADDEFLVNFVEKGINVNSMPG